MKLLILGGTEFAGRALAEEAQRRGWHTTLFNRGSRTPPPGVTAVRGDRTADGGLAALTSSPAARAGWDLVVDTWSWAPRVVRDSARALSGRAAHYSYVSSRSVYREPTDGAQPSALAEQAPTVSASPDADDGAYVRNKRGAEIAVEQYFDGPTLLLRAGLILGPHEDIGRLPWWLNRIHRGGEVLAPGPPELPLQYIDVRDLASWTLDAAAAGRSGPYDVVSQPGHTTMGGLLRTCVEVTGSAARLRWASPETLQAAGIEPWTELPCWLPPGASHRALHGADVSRAAAAGLRVRPVAETVADTWAWLCQLDGAPWRAGRRPVGLSAAREAAVLRQL